MAQWLQRQTKVTWQREICSIKKQCITFWAALYPELPSHLFCWEKIYFLCSLYLCLTFFVNSSFWLILILCCNSFCVRYKKNKETDNNSRGLPSRAPYLHVYRKETHELIFSWLSQLAALLVGVYARWRQSHTRWWPYSSKQVERDMHPWFIPYFFDFVHPCYGQLTPINTRYLLTSITWPYHGLKFRAYWGHVFFF